MNAIDTNVLVYTVDRREPVKQTRARELVGKLIQQSKTVLLWQVAGEYLNCLRRFASRGLFPEERIDEEILDWITAIPLAHPTDAVLKNSLALKSRYSLSHWDSMLIGACLEAGVETLYSEDLAADMEYDTVRVVNPFA